MGHSMGGFTVIVYAHDYPAEVSGLVLIDAEDLPTSNVATHQPAPKPGGTSLPSLLARIGLVCLLADPLGAIENLPEGDKQSIQLSWWPLVASKPSWTKAREWPKEARRPGL